MKKRVAFCLRGAMSRRCGAFFCQNDLYAASPYVHYRGCAESVRKHILDVNRPDYDIDVFVQSWNPDLEADLIELYRPVASLFEDNAQYRDEINRRCGRPTDFGGVSQALAIRKAIDLVEARVRETGATYDMVMLYRPDVLLWKDIRLSFYDNPELPTAVYVNGGWQSDFHFVMTYPTALEFRGVYDSPLHGNPHRMHWWLQKFIENHMRKRVLGDDVQPGRYQEVLRKLRRFSIAPGHISLERLRRDYGISEADV